MSDLRDIQEPTFKQKSSLEQRSWEIVKTSQRILTHADATNPPDQSRWSWCGCSSLRVHGWCCGWLKTPPDRSLTSPTCPERCPMALRWGWSHTPPDTFPPTRLAPCRSGNRPLRVPGGGEGAAQRSRVTEAETDSSSFQTRVSSFGLTLVCSLPPV